jgi:hypothetical protein
MSRRNHSRRQVLATTAVGAVGTAAAQDDGDDEDDDSNSGFIPVVPGAELAAAAGEATQYLVGAVEDVLPFTGPNVDDQSYQDLEAQETHLEIYQDAKEMSAYDEQVLTNIENLVDFAPNALYADAKFAALEVHEQGGTLEEAKTAAKETINERVATSQTNLLKHWVLQVAKIDRMIATMANTDGLNPAAIIDCPSENLTGIDVDPNPDDSPNLATDKRYEIREIHLDWVTSAGAERNDYMMVNGGSVVRKDKANKLRVDPVDSGPQATLIDVDRYSQVYGDLNEVANTTISEINTLLDGVYDQLDSADYDTNDLINGTDLAGFASEQPQSYAAAAADLAALNVPLADPRLVIELPQANDGDGQSYEGTLAISGGADLELQVGKTYSPEDLPGQVVMVYNYRDPQSNELRGTKTVLQQPFRITEATTDDGQSRSTVTFSGRNQQTTETNVDALIKELEQLSETQGEIEQRQRELVVGSGFWPSVDLGEITGTVVQAAALVGGVWIFAQLTGDRS